MTDNLMVQRFLNGEIEYHALMRDERRAAILELVRRGYIPSLGGLKIKRDTYNHAKRRELADREYDNPASTPAVHVDPPCVGHEELFTRAPLTIKEIDLALSMCARCPVVRQCEELVRPRHSTFDGICGGKYYINGTPKKV
jgi:hypothetical protein